MRAPVVVIAVLLWLAAVVHAAPAQPFVGKWKLSKVSTKDGPVAKDKLDKGGMTWEFRADGTMTVTVTAGDKTASSKGTWKVEGNKISLTENGQVNVVTFKRTGPDLVLSATGKSTVVMTFAPVK